MLFAFISFKNSRIPYSDPPVKLRDDIVGNSRIPKDEFRIPRDCFASLAMTQRILEFHIEILGSSPRMTQGLGNFRIPKDKSRIPKQKTTL